MHQLRGFRGSVCFQRFQLPLVLLQRTPGWIKKIKTGLDDLFEASYTMCTQTFQISGSSIFFLRASSPSDSFLTCSNLLWPSVNSEQDHCLEGTCETFCLGAIPYPQPSTIDQATAGWWAKMPRGEEGNSAWNPKSIKHILVTACLVRSSG